MATIVHLGKSGLPAKVWFRSYFLIVQCSYRRFISIVI